MRSGSPRSCIPLAAVALAIACAPPRTESGGADSVRADSVRGGLAAARGVARVGAGRAWRVVPLGPMGGDVEILHGHPDSAGPFVMRIRELPGTVVPPHSHPVDEHITVVRGTWRFAVGARQDSAALRVMPVGTYAFAPAGATMFADSPDGAVVQVHGTGPFHIHWRDGLRALDDPAQAATFRYRIGDAVEGPRGAGRVRQGYASGALVQYEIEGRDGARWMEHERALRRR
jgi:hypothetical protein